MKTKYTLDQFVVEGRYPFPTDMLRYDQCWPKDSESAAEIHRSIARQPIEPGEPVYRVHLVRAVGDRTKQPTTERWRSFGWYIVKEPT